MPTITVNDRLGEIDWSALQPGDTVGITYGIYREKWLFSARGTPDARIRVVGLPGPNGERPIIDGLGATTDPQFAYGYRPVEDGGLVTVFRRADQPNDFRPGYVTFENLEIRGAGWRDPNRSYTAFDGTTRSYSHETAGVFVVCGDGVEIVNCDIHGNGNGVLLLGSQGNQDFAFRRNYLHDNGWSQPGLNDAHNLYVEALGAVYEGNTFGRPYQATNLKDRSCGTIVRNNRIEGGSRLIDLSSAGDSSTLAKERDDYHTATVENNLLILTDDPRDGVQVCYCEGRTDNAGREQVIEFHNNTVACNRPAANDQGAVVLAYSWEGHPGSWPILRASSNLVWVNGKDTKWAPILGLFRREGVAELGPNVFPRNWVNATMAGGGVSVTGQDKLLLAGTADDKGNTMPDPFKDSANGDYTLPPGSPFKGFGCDLANPPPIVPPVDPPDPPPPPPPPAKKRKEIARTEKSTSVERSLAPTLWQTTTTTVTDVFEQEQ